MSVKLYQTGSRLVFPVRYVGLSDYVKRKLVMSYLTFIVACILMIASLPAAIARSYGPVHYGETLWHIAQQMHPESEDVSIEQKVVAIWENNLDAFQDNNMYGLMAGYQLEIPLHSVMARLPRVQAVRIIMQQARAWQWLQQKASQSRQKEMWLRHDADYRQSLSLTLFQTNLYHLQHVQQKLLNLKHDLLAIHESIQVRDQALSVDKSHEVPAWLVTTLIIPLILLISFLWLQLRRHLSHVKEQQGDLVTTSGSGHDVDDEGEYDFLASKEGIATQLDLGRAYIAMDDLAAARKALRHVIKQGSDIQKEQAKDLLTKL